jgi:toxin ParE1/3/4
MRRFEVIFADGANADLRGIHRYIAEVSQSYRTADRFLERVIIRCEKIGNIPFGGRPRDDLLAGLRTVPFEKTTIIAYRVIDDVVEITNVFHGGRDYEALFRDEDDD